MGNANAVSTVVCTGNNAESEADEVLTLQRLQRQLDALEIALTAIEDVVFKDE